MSQNYLVLSHSAATEKNVAGVWVETERNAMVDEVTLYFLSGIVVLKFVHRDEERYRCCFFSVVVVAELVGFLFISGLK